MPDIVWYFLVFAVAVICLVWCEYDMRGAK